jgi:hypothetical protein
LTQFERRKYKTIGEIWRGKAALYPLETTTVKDEYQSDKFSLRSLKRFYFCNMQLIKISLVAFGLLFSTFLLAQRNLKDSVIGSPWVAVNYGGNWTGGDLADRYDFFNHIGVLGGYKTSKNWVFSLDGNFMFGNQLRGTDILAGLRDSKGNITDQNGDVAIVILYSRGFNANASIGKVIPIFGSNLNSGLFLQFGAGYLAHKIRVETQDQVVPQIELDYRKGYDRLAVGPNIAQFVGYSYMADRGFFNFYAGFYFQQGFTKNRRNIFYDQPEIPVSKALRTDLQYGFKIGWFIPVYKRLPKDFYYD